MEKKQSVYLKGIRDGIPIALGYFAVAFALGITARNIGLTWFQAMLASALNNASAGEYAAFELMRSGASYFEVGLITLIANARYLLMSTALTQKLDPKLPLLPRMIIGFEVTDEVFGISIAYPGRLDPRYNYGAMTVAIPGWALGTALGVIMGDILPERLVAALSVALFGMFIAVFVPPARKDKIIGMLVVVSMVLSWAFTSLSCFAFLSDGMRIITLTVLISAVAAILFPVKEEAKA